MSGKRTGGRLKIILNFSYLGAEMAIFTLSLNFPVNLNKGWEAMGLRKMERCNVSASNSPQFCYRVSNRQDKFEGF